MVPTGLVEMHWQKPRYSEDGLAKQPQKNAPKSNFKSNPASLEMEEERIGKLFREGDYYPFQLKEELQEVMWNNVAIIRWEEGLKSALNDIHVIKDKMARMKLPEVRGYNQHLLDALELENMVLIAELVTRSAIIREESRGAHYRADFPETRDECKKSIVLNENEDVKFIKR